VSRCRAGRLLFGLPRRRPVGGNGGLQRQDQAVPALADGRGRHGKLNPGPEDARLAPSDQDTGSIVAVRFNRRLTESRALVVRAEWSRSESGFQRDAGMRWLATPWGGRRNAALGQRYGVRYIPTVVVIDGAGATLSAGWRRQFQTSGVTCRGPVPRKESLHAMVTILYDYGPPLPQPTTHIIVPQHIGAGGLMGPSLALQWGSR
jgi:hypothetical protein